MYDTQFKSAPLTNVWLSPQETGIDMNYTELYKLIESLDRNKDGEINYRYVASLFVVTTFLGIQLIVRTLSSVLQLNKTHSSILDPEKGKVYKRRE